MRTTSGEGSVLRFRVSKLLAELVRKECELENISKPHFYRRLLDYQSRRVMFPKSRQKLGKRYRPLPKRAADNEVVALFLTPQQEEAFNLLLQNSPGLKPQGVWATLLLMYFDLWTFRPFRAAEEFEDL